MKFIIIFMTCPNVEEAAKIVQHLLEEKLIACGNIVGNIQSYYWWKEKIEKENEYLVLMKTSQDKFEMVKNRVKSLHSYDVPEIVALPIEDGLQEYLDWIETSIK